MKKLLSELKKYKVQTILALKLNAKLIASDSDIDEAFKSMHQNIMAEITNSTSKYWTDIERIIKHGIKIFECYYK